MSTPLGTTRRLVPIIAICFASILVSACGVRETIIKGKQPPDEFAIYTRAPLSIPPDYSLRVPEPGAARPQEEDPSVTAQQVILGTIVKTPQAQDEAASGSLGMQALLRDTGALNVDPSIREIVNRETSVLAEESVTIVDSIIFWQDPSEYGTVVDPNSESKRIQENQALGQPITAGSTPIIIKKQETVIDKLF